VIAASTNGRISAAGKAVLLIDASTPGPGEDVSDLRRC